MNKEMSIRAQNLLGPVFSGACWLISGLCEFGNGMPFTIINIIAMGIACITSLWVTIKGLSKRSQKGDEMSDLHMHQAVFRSYAILFIVLMLFSTAALMSRAALGTELIENWYAWTKIFIALMMLLPGIFFALAERNVDQCQD